MIKLRSKQLKAAVTRRGATLAGLWHAGFDHCLVLGAPDPAPYQNDLTYVGAIVGPVANRISDGLVAIDGQHWQMDANEGATCLHSGPAGLHARIWDIADQSEHSVTLTCALRHGECGLPGERDISVRYCLDGTALLVEMQATTDRTTVMNLAHHPYWNLDGRADIGQHRLQVAAETYLPTDANTLPTGEVALVQGTAYDFRKPKTLPVDLTLDANLCLSSERPPEPRLAARLSAPKAPTLEIHTTEPGLQIYNGSGLQPCAAKLHNGQKLAPYAGLALEPQAWPDAPKNPGFSSILLKKQQTYLQRTRYHISR